MPSAPRRDKPCVDVLRYNATRAILAPVLPQSLTHPSVGPTILISMPNSILTGLYTRF